MHSTNPVDFQHASWQGHIGVSRTDITPPIGIYARNWGAAQHDVAETIHRSLTLTALTLTPREGGTTLIFVDADLGWWKTPQTFYNFQKRLLDTLSLESANLIFGLSHTHAGPPLMAADDSLPGGDLLRAWLEHVFASTVHVIRDALALRFEGTLDWHHGRCDLATVRDLPDPDPVKQRVVCGYNPAGKPDDTLYVGRVTDATGQIRATLVNYACHPTTLAWDNKAISPDYLGAMRDTMQQSTGVPAMFMLELVAIWPHVISMWATQKSQTVTDGNSASRHSQRCTAWSRQAQGWRTPLPWNPAHHWPSGSIRSATCLRN